MRLHHGQLNTARTSRSPTNTPTTSASTTWSTDCRKLAPSAGSAKRTRFAAGRPRRKSISLITRKTFTRSKKNGPQRRRRGPAVSTACAKAAQRKPSSANRGGRHRSYRRPAASYHTTREADPIWNSPISRYIRTPRWHHPCISMGIVHFPRGHAIPLTGGSVEAVFAGNAPAARRPRMHVRRTYERQRDDSHRILNAYRKNRGLCR